MRLLQAFRDLSLAALCIVMCVFFWQLRKDAKALGASANSLVQNTDKQLNGTDAQHGTDGLLFATKKSVDDVRAGAVIASRQETQYYASLKAHTETVAAQAQTTLGSLNSAVQSINDSQQAIAADTHQSFAKLNVAIDQIPPAIQKLTQAEEAARVLISDPSIPKTLDGLAKTSQNAAEITERGEAIASNAEDMSDDAKKGFHKWLNPSKAQVFMGVVEKFGLAAIAAHW
jgi:hypothetical protein